MTIIDTHNTHNTQMSKNTNNNSTNNTFKPNEEYQVTLNDNPTTGYIWMYVSENSTDTSKVTSEVKREIIRQKNTEGMVGAPSQLVITFKSEKSDKLKFYHVRPWLVKDITKLHDLIPDFVFDITITA